ncbi:MAG: hypothetical protein HQK65_08290 [Desulfamplus sp.]|nr:hypothetical protein [Desulfamplus sp.]
MNFTVVVFVNSIKHGQYCVAGKILNNNKWIRPVATFDGKELNCAQAKYVNPYGKFIVKPLQKIQMDFSRYVPLPHQPENYLISGNDWVQNYSISINEIESYLDYPDSLWGVDNYIENYDIYSGIRPISQSLYLVNVINLCAYINNQNRRRVSFIYNNINYDLPATDPTFDDLINGKRGHNNLICASLGEEFQGRHYKIIAGIL